MRLALIISAVLFAYFILGVVWTFGRIVWALALFPLAFIDLVRAIKSDQSSQAGQQQP